MVNLKNLTQKKWCKALKRLGMEVDKKKGKGSHYRVVNPATNQKTTLPSDCHQYISLDIYKTLLQWGVSEEDLDKALR